MTKTSDHALCEATRIEHLYGLAPLEMLAESMILTRVDQRFRVSVSLDPKHGWISWSDLSRERPHHGVVS